MADRYQTFATSAPGRLIVGRLGMPQPTPLRRHEQGDRMLHGPALLGAAEGGRLLAPAAAVLRAAEADGFVPARGAPQQAALDGALHTEVWDSSAENGRRFAALVFDASAISTSDGMREAFEFFSGAVASLLPCGRALILATPPETCEGRGQAIAQRALEGFSRTLGKEVRNGATSQLVYVAPGAEANLESTLRFFLSAKSAYVSGQVVRIGAGEAVAPADWDAPLDGKVALVTGASRGIGESIAATLARDGAHVICLDVPDQGELLVDVANRIGGSTLQLDVAVGEAPRLVVDHVRERHGGVDVVVHNAGITRDKSLARMTDEQWDAVLAINLAGPLRINESLLESDALRPGGRIVGVSSVSGIAGNRGQANYATSKAGVIGMVQALAPVLAPRPATINAVAPGFIETQMTAAMPVPTREAGRRMNSLSQGGLPVDVAETIAWLANPGSGGVNGNVIRVCGQALLGA